MRLINLGGANSDLLLPRVGADIRGAVNAVVAFWGTDWAREISVVAAGSDEQFRTAAGGGTASQWADIAAVTGPSASILAAGRWLANELCSHQARSRCARRHCE